MPYDKIVYIIDSIAALVIFFFLCFLWYYLSYFVIATKKPKQFPKAEEKASFGILVPARNESKVIRNILESLSKLDYPSDNYGVYVIVETLEDPTCEICKEYGQNVHIVVRGDLTNRRTKGFALDDAYHYLKDNNIHYDAYMIFDADNVVSSNYLLLMNDVYQAGYQVGVGYRSFTNATKNWICSCSATLFSFMNQFTSKGRTYLFKKATLTGTGYFIRSEIVDDAGGWIWNGMTEDVELTTYCYYHNITMCYYPFARYFDEQAEKMSVLRKQHVRWVWGFFENRKRFKEGHKVYPPQSKRKRRNSLIEYNSSIYPFVILVVSLLICAIASLAIAIIGNVRGFEDYGWLYAHAIFQFSLLYITFVFIAAFTLGIDNKNLKFSGGRCVIVCLTYIFFFQSFLIAFLEGLFCKKKRTNWVVIEHKGDIVDKQALEANNKNASK